MKNSTQAIKQMPKPKYICSICGKETVTLIGVSKEIKPAEVYLGFKCLNETCNNIHNIHQPIN